MSISKELLEQSFKNKSDVKLKDLILLIEENFGYTVTLNKINDVDLSSTQKKRMTSEIFKDESVLYQLQQAKKDREDGISSYSDNEEEFAKLVAEVDHERK